MKPATIASKLARDSQPLRSHSRRRSLAWFTAAIAVSFSAATTNAQTPAPTKPATPAATPTRPANRAPDGPSVREQLFKQVDVQNWVLISQYNLPGSSAIPLNIQRENPLNPRGLEISLPGAPSRTLTIDRNGGVFLPSTATPNTDPRLAPGANPLADRYLKEFRDSRNLSWDEGVIYVPAGINTSFSEAQFATATVQAWFDGQELSMKNPPVRADLQAGARYFQIDLGARERTKNIRIEVRQPYRSIERQFNEEIASTIPWHDPKTPWPSDAKSALEPVFLAEFRHGIEGQPDPIQAEVDRSREEVQKFLTKWTAGGDLRKLAPYTAAKFITGRVLDTFSVSGRALDGPDGGSLRGVKSRTVPEILTGKTAQPEDLPVLLAAFLRTAGIPARTVYAVDVRRESSDTDRRIRIQPPGRTVAIRIWTEFALWDPTSRSAIWIPADILEQRKDGARAPSLDRRWEWFGHNQDSAFFVPISFHVSPPLPAFSFDLPNFFSYYLLPYTPPMSSVSRFDVISQTSRDVQQNRPTPGRNR